jgi:glucosyl-dolichyl phosphate glucuronosyltransferase
MFVSVVICTYKRKDSLKITLDSFFAQEGLADIEYELLIIDNNSRDNTQELIGSYIEKCGNTIKFFIETDKGASFARNRGIKESKGDLIAFTDDDVIIDKGWLTNLVTAFQKYNADAVGGRVLPVYPPGTPQWIKDNQDILCGPIVAYDHGEKIEQYGLVNPIMPIGANMAFRKHLFRQFGLFRTDIGAGTGTSEEDTEFFMRLWEDPDAKIFYCGQALVWHPVVQDRMTLKYIANYKISYGRSEVIISRVEHNTYVKILGIPCYLMLKFVEDIILLIFTSFTRRKFLKNWMRIFFHFGTFLQFRQDYLARLKS